MKLKMTSSRNGFQAIMPISIREQIRTHSTNTWAISMPQITYECAYKMTFEKKTLHNGDASKYGNGQKIKN